jgi:hypothetical protein
MIEHADNKIAGWLSSTLPKTPVRFAPPGAEPKEAGLRCYLYELAAAQPGRAADGQRAPLQIAVRYLVTATAADEAVAHQMVGEALTAALETADFEVNLSIASTLWQSFALPPRPAFTISFIVRKDRPEPAVALVRHPVDLRTTPLRSVRGRLFGPNKIPLSHARVEIPSLHASAATDDAGRFVFSALPASALPKSVLVKARNREFIVTADLTSENPVDLTVQFPEE